MVKDLSDKLYTFQSDLFHLSLLADFIEVSALNDSDVLLEHGVTLGFVLKQVVVDLQSKVEELFQGEGSFLVVKK